MTGLAITLGKPGLRLTFGADLPLPAPNTLGPPRIIEPVPTANFDAPLAAPFGPMNAERGRCTSAGFSGATAVVKGCEDSPGSEEVDDEALPMDATVDALCNPPLGRPIPRLLASTLRVDSARVLSVSSRLKPMLVFGRSGGGILSFSSADAKV